MKLLKKGLSIRGDSYYCPLSFQLDTYWNCENNCHHCYLRRLNNIWGWDLKPLDVELFKKQIINGLKNKNPRSSLAWAIKQKKTIRLGNKTDPYQDCEKQYKVTRKVVKFLVSQGFSFVIQTMFTQNVFRDFDIFKDYKNLVSFMPIVSPGLNKDWDIFEKQGTTESIIRLRDAVNWQKRGFNVGINGEPFIPGYHIVKDFENTLKVLKSYGLKSYNTYHLHLNDWVAKNFVKIGLDIEKIWIMNQDQYWKPILSQLIDLAKKYDIILGCPDFVNSGKYQESTNTCCGLNVLNPCTFNIINWKKRANECEPYDEIIENTWDGIGNKETGKRLLYGEEKEFYSLKDIVKEDRGFLDELF